MQARQRQRQQEQGPEQQSQQQLVLQVLFRTDPRYKHCSYSRRLLRPFHTTCHAGRSAALRTIDHVNLRRGQQRGVSYPHQLSVLLAADCARSLEIGSDQVSGLLVFALTRLLEQLQQQQQRQAAPMPGEGHGAGQLQAPHAAGSGALSNARALGHAAATTNATSSSSAPCYGPAVNSAVTALGGRQLPMPAKQWLVSMCVVGDMTLATAQNLVHLLDVLPCTQQLKQLVLRNIPNARWMQRLVSSLSASKAPREVHMQTEFHNATLMAVCTSSSAESMLVHHRPGLTMAEREAGVGPSWRSRCWTMLVCRQDTSSEAVSSSSSGSGDGGSSSSWVCLSDISPLLEAMQSLWGLYLEGVEVTDLSLWAAHLQPLWRLTIKDCPGAGTAEFMAQVPLLTALRQLDVSCEVPQELTQLPAALSQLVHMTSLVLYGVGVTSGALEAVCGISGLRKLEVNNSPYCTSLPDSISNLESLDWLGVSLCGVYSLPPALTGCLKLHHVTLGPTKVARPLELDTLWSLKRLHSVALVDRFLTVLPPDIGQLTALNSLILKVRSLADIPGQHLRGLECLTLMIVEAEEMPEAVTTLTHLTSLELYCESLLRLPSGLGALVGLQHLVIEAERLEALPASITALTALTSITLERPALQALPPAVKAFVEERGGRVQQ
jgi:Leucine-rich repeat (LRR) protein